MRAKVIKKIALNSQQTWQGNKGACLLVMVDHENHRIEFQDIGNGSPDVDAFFNFVLNDKDVRKELQWAIKQYKRKYPFWIEHYVGQSGCEDIDMKISATEHKWAMSCKRLQSTVVHMHISCYGKLNEGIPDFFSGDLLDLLQWKWQKENNTEVINNEFYYAVARNRKREWSEITKKWAYSYIPYHYKEIIPGCSICGSADWSGLSI